MPPKKMPESPSPGDLHKLRHLLGQIAEACAERSHSGSIISDRNKYARCLSHIAAAIAELPET